MDNLINIIDKVDTTNFTLIIPSVAVGNVGQLTIDLLISSYRFKKYATIWHPAIIPTVGGDPFFDDPSEISTACELFINEDLRLVVMQIRSGIESKLALSFFRKLKESLDQFGFKQTLIITSAFAYELHNVTSSHYRYVSNDRIPKLEALNVPQMEKDADDQYTIFGGGYATKLYDILNDSVIIFKYTSEGDNRPDALEMMNILCSFLGNFNGKICQISYPTSWKYAFGGPPPLGIY
ncbi:hypothetical protein RI129_011287 [Pyrocoelia pectoralis]|uniref:Proteasome assembly chaperone 2 n=1 Tax=Pyrocoelia pectoralis TaxID=417401 RepID=A0AAN7ZHC4_9COLE